MTTIGSYPSSLLNAALNGYGGLGLQSNTARTPAQNPDDSSPYSSSSTNVTLSDAAKNYLAGLQSSAQSGADNSTLSGIASSARSWLDDQYQSLGISSALLDGKVAVDFTDQSRATLSAIASNAGGLFTSDETKAASTELQSRFNAAVSSHAVVARHTGDYAGLYQAASDYLDQAGDDEKATAAWKTQKQAVLAGLSDAKAHFGKAPDTNANDPVRSLLTTPTASATSLGPDATTADVAAHARALLDDQENSARDNGTELVFNASRKTGQQADLSKFDNRTLATIVLNQDSSFSTDEVRAAKTELDQRTRSSILKSLSPSSGNSGSPGLLQFYSGLSDEEKTVLGVTQETTNRIAQAYKTQQSVQNTLAAYL